MKKFSQSKKAVCFLFTILFCFAVADYAASDESKPSAYNNAVPLTAVKTALKELTDQLRLDIEVIKAATCQMAEDSDTLIVGCQPCPCWTEDDLIALTPTDASAYSCSDKTESSGELSSERIINLMRDECQYSGCTQTCEYQGALWDGLYTYRLTADGLSGRGMCRTYGYTGTTQGCSYECENNLPAYYGTLTPEQTASCINILLKRIKALGLNCD